MYPLTNSYFNKKCLWTMNDKTELHGTYNHTQVYYNRYRIELLFIINKVLLLYIKFGK